MINQKQLEPILNRVQAEKVEIAFDLIVEVKDEIKQEDFHTAVLLGVAANNCKQVIENDLPDGYVKPERIRAKVKYKPTTGERILNVLGWIAGTSLLSSALCGCIALSSWGLSEFKGALDTKILQGTDFAAETKGYRGLAIAFFGVTLSASTLGAVVGDAIYRSND